MHARPIFLDRASEAYDLLAPLATKDFHRLGEIGIVPDSIYVIGRIEMDASRNMVEEIIQQQSATIVFINAAEGSETMLGQFYSLRIKEWANQGRILVITGGEIDDHYRHLTIEYFLIRLHDFQENISAQARTFEIFEKREKPYKFLFLNGRLRHHRKWLLEFFRSRELLTSSIYTCLQGRIQHARGLTFIQDEQDLMFREEPKVLLNKKYECDFYHDQLDLPCSDDYVKSHIFKKQWGEAYIRPEPYIDTYFSLVTETVFDSPWSFRTEKIWKPIIMGHPWIAVANHGFYRSLRNLGFRSFDSLIDENFDYIGEGDKRISRIATVVQDLCNQDLPSFLEQARSICIYNQQHARELAQDCRCSFPKHFLEFLEKHPCRI